LTSANFKFRPNPQPPYGRLCSPHEKQFEHNEGATSPKFAPEPAN
jgi:hypothetical protein